MLMLTVRTSSASINSLIDADNLSGPIFIIILPFCIPWGTEFPREIGDAFNYENNRTFVVYQIPKYIMYAHYIKWDQEWIAIIMT